MSEKQGEPKRKNVSRGRMIELTIFIAGILLLVAGIIITVIGINSSASNSISKKLLPLSAAFVLIGIISVAEGLWIDHKHEVVARLAVFQSLWNAIMRFQPEKSLKTLFLFVFRKEDVTILVRRLFNGAYFIKLFKENPTAAHAVELPFTGQSIPLRPANPSSYSISRQEEDEVNGLPIIKAKGEFTVLTDILNLGTTKKESYSKGPGVLYFLRLNPTIMKNLRHDPEKPISTPHSQDLLPTIQQIMEKLSRERPPN